MERYQKVTTTMLVKNPLEVTKDLNKSLYPRISGDVGKILYFCITDKPHKENMGERTKYTFDERINSAAKEIEKNFNKVRKDYYFFTGLIIENYLSYSWDDGEYWKDIYKYIIGEQSLKVIDNHKKEEYVLSVYPLPKNKTVAWKDIRKLRL